MLSVLRAPRSLSVTRNARNMATAVTVSAETKSSNIQNPVPSSTEKPEEKKSKAATLSHIERTAEEPRGGKLYKLTLAEIMPITENIKRFTLRLAKKDKKGVVFLPGQWVDLYCPGIPKPGGFTITSPPHHSRPGATSAYLELAVQRSDSNPPAAYLWRPAEEILGSKLKIRVGGSFVWPPPLTPDEIRNLKRLVFVAGGVGINPLISILRHLQQQKLKGLLSFSGKIVFLYSAKAPEDLEKAGKEVLFLRPLIVALIKLGGKKLKDLRLFLTGTQDFREKEKEFSINIDCGGAPVASTLPVAFERRRFTQADILAALGIVKDRDNVCCYVCGPPAMTDEVVEFMRKTKGMDARKVLSEKWW